MRSSPAAGRQVRSGLRPRPREPPREISPPVGSSLQPGVELFKQKKYDQASEFFDGLTRTKPDDARAWYYAALARAWPRATGKERPRSS